MNYKKLFVALFLLLTTNTIFSQSVVVNKIYNDGTSASNDAVELLVVTDNLDMRNLYIKDFSANNGSDGGRFYQFANTTFWSSLRAGTLIILRNNATAADITTSCTDFVLDIGMLNATYFTPQASVTFDISTNDMVMIKSTAGTGTTNNIHAFKVGTSGTQWTGINSGVVIGTSTSSASVTYSFVVNTNATIADFSSGYNTNTTTGIANATTGITFGLGNNTNNTNFINFLRGPVSSAASGIGSTAFTANWSALTGASSYILDVSTASDFSSFVTGYNGLNVGNVTTYPVNTNISASTTYYYRVRAVNATPTTSGNSCVQNLTTSSAGPVVTLANNGTQITAGNVPQGTNNHILSSFQLTVANATTNLTQASFLALGNYQSADINGAGFTLWYNSTNTFGTAVTVGTALSSTSTGSGDVLIFSGFTRALAVGINYFWVTANISSSATVTRFINIDTIANADLIFSSGTKSGSASAAGSQTITPLTKTTIANGDWANGAIWSPAGVPASSNTVIINHAVTSGAAITRDAGTTSTISLGASLAVSAFYTNNGTTSVNGTFQLDSGGWANGSTNFTYGANGTLVFNAAYTANNGTYWPAANGPVNVTVTAAGILTGGFSRTVSGVFQTSNGVDFTGFTLTLNGTCQINSGGYFNASPVYGNTSLLRYNSGGTFRRGFEWLANGVGTIGTTAGYPNNVQLSSNTTFDYNNGNPANKAMNGSLTIDSGSVFNMTDTTMGAPSAGTLTIAGSVINNGTFTLADVATPVVVAGNYTNAGTTTMGATALTELRITGNFNNSGTITLGAVSGADMRVGGDFTNTGTFNGNARAVFFTKTGTQTVTSSSTLTIPYFRTAASGTTVQLASGTNVIISAPNGGIAITFANAADVIDINGNTLTIGTVATANTISGTGSFKGSTTSNLTLLGTGSLGTVSFVSGSQNLGTFTMNRQAATVGCVMGSAVTINTSLVLTNGLIDLGSNSMTLASTCSNTFTASANSYVIADVTSGGVLSKAITATATTYNFPIGDRTASADGSQYSPATVNFTAGSFTSAFLGIAVEDSKHPNMDATTHFISRYWVVTSSGTFTTPTYTFGANYLALDINGTQTTSRANQWNGTIWSNSGGAIGGNAMSIGGCTNLTAPNHFSAGQRDREINILHVPTATNYLTGSTYNFGNVLIGSPSDVVFTIQNLGQQTLTLGNSGGNLPSVTGNPPYSLQVTYNYATPTILGMNSTIPNTQTFTIRFNPVASGTFTGSITIRSDDADEGSGYVINFTGVGVTPVPEINIQGLGIDIAPGNTPVTTDNTLFGSQNIGTPSAANSFVIQNLGTGTLTLSGLSPFITLGGANPGDFSVSVIPSNSIAPSSSTTFSIIFNPTATGIRDATVTIFSNDSDEGTYTFNISGDAVCVGTNTITPTSGPVGTEVTITATSNNLTGASVTFLGAVATSVTYISSTQIKAIIPSTAVNGTGTVTTTNSLGCIASNTFTVIKNSLTSCEGAGITPTDLFISEVTDATYGGLTYIEIYNGTSSSINLGTYSLQFFANGSATSYGTQALSGTIAVGATYVVATSLSGFSCGGVSGGNGSLANLTSLVAGINFVTNGHDFISLYNGASKIDSWGTYLNSSWAASLGIGDRGVDFRRKNNVTPLPNPNSINSDWDVIDWGGTGSSSCSSNDYSNIGTYNILTTGTVPPTVTQNPTYTPTCKATSLTVAGTEGNVGGSPLAYQWYGVAPNTATWTSLTDTGVYTGSTTATLNISDISTLIGYQFYCQVRENTSSCYSASNAVMITAGQSTTWQAGNSWSNGVPDLDKAVIINNNYDTSINGNLEACSITVNNGFTLLANANNYVLIKNDLTVNAGGAATFENNSSLVQINNVANTGNITYKRIAQQRKSDYVYWSSPVNGFNLSSHPSNGYKFLWNTTLNNANGTQGNWQTASGVMNAGQGYIVSGPSTFNNTVNQNLEVPFLGVPRNGNYSVTINRGSYTGANYTLPPPSNATVTNLDDNWNLLGNPYPSAISCRGFLTNNSASLTGALYIWTHGTLPSISTSNPFYNTFYSNYNAATDYVPFNLTGNLANPNPDYYIGAGQGFFVTMKDGAAGSATVNFTNSLRDKSYANATGTNFFRPSGISTHTQNQTPEYSRIWIDLVKENRPPVRTMFGYVDGATMQRDNLFDAISKRDGTLKLYTLINDENFVIQGRSVPFEENDQVPLGMNIIESGDYKIAIAIVDGLFEHGQPIYLEDKYLDVIFDLRQNPYSFSTVAGTFNDRFVIRYTNTTLSNPDFETIDHSVVLAANHGEMTIKSYIENINEVTVYDVLGRELFNAKNLSNTSFVTSNITVSQQTLIVKIKLENGLTISRKIIL